MMTTTACCVYRVWRLMNLALAYRSSGPEFEPRRRRNLLNRKRRSIAHSLSLSSAHRPDMTEMLLKTT